MKLNSVHPLFMGFLVYLISIISQNIAAEMRYINIRRSKHTADTCDCDSFGYLKCLALLENVIGSRKHETVEEEVRKEEED